MRNLYRIKYFIWICAGVLLLNGCYKSADPDPVENNKLIVAFSSATIPIDNVDSVTAVFTVNTDTIKKAGLREGSFYSFLFDGLGNGTYQVTTRVYTGKDSTGTMHMYRYQSSVNTNSNNNLSGPTAKAYDTWKPSLYFHNSKYNITFAVAQSPADSYFDLLLPPNLYFKNVYIARNLYNTVSDVKYPVGFGYTTFKTADYKGYTVNTTAFTSFTVQASSTQYTSADVTFELYNDRNKDYEILFTKEVGF